MRLNKDSAEAEALIKKMYTFEDVKVLEYIKKLYVDPASSEIQTSSAGVDDTKADNASTQVSLGLIEGFFS